MKCVAIIPARGGSRRIPGKNIREFHGRPILAYSIETAQQSGLFNAGIWVSTDDEEIGSLAVELGAKCHPRASEFADDVTGTQEVMAHVLAELWPARTRRPEAACCIYATAPMLTPQDLITAHDLMLTQHCYLFVPGWYYWGKAKWFMEGRPLYTGCELAVDPARYIDINTIEDFRMAEKMYAELRVR